MVTFAHSLVIMTSNVGAASAVKGAATAGAFQLHTPSSDTDADDLPYDTMKSAVMADLTA